MSNAAASKKRIYKVIIDAPIETVWSQLVKTDEVLPFFFGSVCDCQSMEEGQPFAMRSPNGKYTSVVGEVLEFSPPYRYSHTFKFTAYDDEPCTVSYELKQTDAGVEFLLITENTPEGSQTEKSMDQGGTFIVDALKSLIEKGQPNFKTRMILLMISLAAIFTPGRCKSERWPLKKGIADA